MATSSHIEFMFKEEWDRVGVALGAEHQVSRYRVDFIDLPRKRSLNWMVMRATSLPRIAHTMPPEIGSRSVYASPRYLVDPIEGGVQAQLAELMAEVRGQGGVA